jgi:hypothetical protein
MTGNPQSVQRRQPFHHLVAIITFLQPPETGMDRPNRNPGIFDIKEVPARAKGADGARRPPLP